MGVEQLLLGQILVMFLIMFVGFALYKKGMLTDQGSRDMNQILLYVIFPSVIIKAFLMDCTLERLRQLGFAYLISAAALLLSMVVAALVFGKRYRMENFGSAFSNAGFMGLPVVQAVIGEEAVLFVSAFVVLLNLLQWTYGVVIITRKKDAIRLEKLKKNPVLISFAIGMLLFLLPIKVPEFASKTLSMFSSMNAPFAMLSLGVYLAQTDLRALVRDRQAYLCSAVRLLVIPALTILLFRFLPAKLSICRMAIFIAACAPVGANVAIFAQIYKEDYTYAVRSVCLSTLASLAAMPLMLKAAELIW